jgi:hypothetical protein
MFIVSSCAHTQCGSRHAYGQANPVELLSMSGDESDPIEQYCGGTVKLERETGTTHEPTRQDGLKG